MAKSWGIVVSIAREEDASPPRLVSFEKAHVTIGAAAECDVVIADPAVSANHAHITLSAGQITIYDDQSRNGTWVANERVKSRSLGEDDAVLIRPFRLRFSLVEAGRRRTKRWEHTAPASLVVMRGPAGTEGQRHELGSRGFRIGRGMEAELSFPGLETLSRNHAEVRPRKRGIWVVADLGSANGTLVGGHLVKDERRLFPGDEIALGRDLTLRFEQREAGDPDLQPTEPAADEDA